jgi:hypothetical protein
MGGDAEWTALSSLFFRDEGIDIARPSNAVVVTNDISVSANDYTTRLWNDA